MSGSWRLPPQESSLSLSSMCRTCSQIVACFLCRGLVERGASQPAVLPCPRRQERQDSACGRGLVERGASQPAVLPCPRRQERQDSACGRGVLERGASRPAVLPCPRRQERQEGACGRRLLERGASQPAVLPCPRRQERQESACGRGLLKGCFATCRAAMPAAARTTGKCLWPRAGAHCPLSPSFTGRRDLSRLRSPAQFMSARLCVGR